MSDLRNKSLGLLAQREHSKAELKRKLKLKGGEPAEIDALVERLAAQGLQSDARFVENFIHSRLNHGYGPLRIAQELRNKGVTEAQFRDLLTKDDDTWQAHLQAVWQKKYHGELPKNNQEKARQLRFLHSRGFAVGMIMKLFDQDSSWS